MRPGAASWRVITMCWVRLLPPQIRVATATHSYGRALLSGPVRAGILEHAARSDYAARTAQVIGLGFRTTRRHGHRPARYMKGPPQVHLGSMRGQRKRARQAMQTSAGTACCPGMAAQRTRHSAGSTVPPRPGRYPRADPVGHAWADCRVTNHLRGPGGDGGPPKSRRSGSVNRSSCPDSVRHMTVTTAMQGLTAAHRETQRDNIKAARRPRYAQATGRFRRWWQVLWWQALGSNQRRLSRRFYRPNAWFAYIQSDLRLFG